METYLIVGLPGVGKSTLLRVLAAEGHPTLDADTDESLSQWQNHDTGNWTRHRDFSRSDWNEHYSWRWNGDRMRELLAQESQSARFIGGNAGNVKDFYQFFDRVFALVLDDHELASRIRTRGSGYGSNPGELQSIIGWNHDFAEEEIRRGATIIDASPAPQEIARKILDYTSNDSR